MQDRNLGILVRPQERTDAVVACADLIEQITRDREDFRQRARKAVDEEQWDLRAHVGVWRELLFLDGGDARK